MKKRLILKKLKGDIWNLKPVLTGDEFKKITREHVVEMLHNGAYVSAIDTDDLELVCRDIERMIIEKLQNRLK